MVPYGLSSLLFQAGTCDFSQRREWLGVVLGSVPL